MRGQSHKWDRALLAAVLNGLVFFALTAVLSLFGAPTGAHVFAAGLFGVGALASSYLLVTASGGLTAFTFFNIGCGLLLGFGTVYSAFSNELIYRTYFDPFTQREFIPKINLVNATAVVISMAAATVLSRRRQARTSRPIVLVERLAASGKRFALPVLLASFALLVLELFLFDFLFNGSVGMTALLAGLLQKLSPVVSFSVLLGALAWTRLSLIERALLIAVFVLDTALGALIVSKTGVVFPLLTLGGGFFAVRKTRSMGSAILAMTAVSYVALIAPLSQAVRYDFDYSAADNSMQDRVWLIQRNLSTLYGAKEFALDQRPKAMSRFAFGPFQAYLIQQHDTGRSGTSLEDSLIALIPRIVWPDKPDVALAGLKLHREFFQDESQVAYMAPTFPAEGYWNFGYLGVAFVSIIVGLEIGLLTARWWSVVDGRRSGWGSIVCLPATLLFGFAIEQWFVIAYAGGFIVLWLTISLIDFLVGRSLGQRVRPPGPERLAAVRSAGG